MKTYFRPALLWATCTLAWACGDAAPTTSGVPGAVRACADAGCAYHDPWAPGPYPVGMRNDLVFDPSRSALKWDGCAGGPPCPRPIPISIWYPAAEPLRNAEPISFADFFSVGEDELEDIINTILQEFGSDAVDITIPDKQVASILDAPLNESGRWPVIFFSHGAGGVRFQSLFLTEHLASHGYIVVAPDHEGDATVSDIGGEIVSASSEFFERSALERPRDVRFLIDRVIAWDADPAHWLYGRAAASAGVGLTGHSFGAYTSITLAGIDSRVAAIVPMAAPGISGFGEPVPTMFMLASEDKTIDAIGNDGIRAEYELAPEPKAKVELLDAGHFTFSNLCDLFPDFGDGCGTGERITTGEPLTYVNDDDAFVVINGLATAWFGAYLRNEPRYINDLDPTRFAERVRYSLEVVTHPSLAGQGVSQP